ncbi:hypothetical protein AVEN_67865-1 [Araneus ventricosus]|uniref:Uncharacterized protein n=1 Tax=Araneus ventricosus TaxID=182803 RepID=A0A4Y2NTD9_ARAVE|nr:hypothetical protein AVEN_67865-1 [Araneus ventricosus]
MYRVIQNQRNKLLGELGYTYTTRNHIAMRGRKCNPKEIGGCKELPQENCRQSLTEVLGWKIIVHSDRKLPFKDHKRKINHEFPDNEVARTFLATCLFLTVYSFARLRAWHYWLIIPASLFILQLIRGSGGVLKDASSRLRRTSDGFRAYFKTSEIPCGAHVTKLRTTSLSGKP